MNKSETRWDDPNRQAVGLDPVGAAGGGEGTPAPQARAGDDLDKMTKDELLAYAKERGISPANAAMSKDEIRESIDNA